MAHVWNESAVASTHGAALERLFSRIGEVSSFPIAARRIIDVASDDGAGADELLRAVEGDPAMAVKLLRTVNASFYSRRNRIADLKQAITLLGFRSVRAMALTVYVARMFRSGDRYGAYSREGLWEHMAAVAGTSRMIAEVCGSAPADEAYTAGLLHDVGLILIDQHLNRHFCGIIDSLAPDAPTCEAERQRLSFDHAQLGEFVTRQWHFPEAVSAAAGYHHAPQLCEGPCANVVLIVALANYLCSRQGVTSLGVHNVAAPADEAFQKLSMPPEKMSMILQRLDQSLNDAALASAI